jgi:hypothetical protein
VKEELNTKYRKFQEKKPNEILEIKSVLSQMKNTGKSHYGRLEQVSGKEFQDF